MASWSPGLEGCSQYQGPEPKQGGSQARYACIPLAPLSALLSSQVSRWPIRQPEGQAPQ